MKKDDCPVVATIIRLLLDAGFPRQSLDYAEYAEAMDLPPAPTDAALYSRLDSLVKLCKVVNKLGRAAGLPVATCWQAEDYATLMYSYYSKAVEHPDGWLGLRSKACATWILRVYDGCKAKPEVQAGLVSAVEAFITEILSRDCL